MAVGRYGFGGAQVVLGDERYIGKVRTTFIRLFLFLFLVTPSQLQKQKSAPRNDSRLEERLGMT